VCAGDDPDCRFSKLYRGIASPIMAEAPKRAMKFSMNEQYKKIFTDASGKLSGLGHVAAGGCAGMTEALVNCPFELVKVRMQARSNAGLYKNTWHAAQSVIQNEGAATLYRGFGSMLWRNGVWNGAYFGIIQQVKRLLPVWPSERGQLATNFTAGTISGLIATMLNTPFDVVKSRIQNTLPGQPRRYTYTLPALATVAREEGFAALYKGFVPKVLRLAPGGGIMLVQLKSPIAPNCVWCKLTHSRTPFFLVLMQVAFDFFARIL
jgi:solute carrier family 25 2-oxodicarboxylate transporter 21